MRVKIAEGPDVDAERLGPGRLEDSNVRDGATVVLSSLLDDGERGGTIDA